MEPMDSSSRWLIRKYIPELSAQNLDQSDGLAAQYVALTHSRSMLAADKREWEQQLVELKKKNEAVVTGKQIEDLDTRIKQCDQQIQQCEECFSYCANKTQALLGRYPRRAKAVPKLQLARRRLAVRKGKYGFSLRAVGRDIKSLHTHITNYMRYCGAWHWNMFFLAGGRLCFLLGGQLTALRATGRQPVPGSGEERVSQK